MPPASESSLVLTWDFLHKTIRSICFLIIWFSCVVLILLAIYYTCKWLYSLDSPVALLVILLLPCTHVAFYFIALMSENHMDTPLTHEELVAVGAVDAFRREEMPDSVRYGVALGPSRGELEVERWRREVDRHRPTADSHYGSGTDSSFSVRSRRVEAWRFAVESQPESLTTTMTDYMTATSTSRSVRRRVGYSSLDAFSGEYASAEDGVT